MHIYNIASSIYISYKIMFTNTNYNINISLNMKLNKATLDSNMTDLFKYFDI